ncbi:hypothetical protein RB195_008270 [Necator americanus]|uniref:Uncharacterized protein n=1 Tax=Necator americanus TaxID=51031 RepID=A0ABR1CNQ6_NECAM
MQVVTWLQRILTALLVLFSVYSAWYIFIKQDIIDMDRIQRRRRKENMHRHQRILGPEQALRKSTVN